MKGQIKNQFDTITLKKIGLEALKLGGITAGLYILTIAVNWNFGNFTPLAIPMIRWAIGILEQYKKEE